MVDAREVADYMSTATGLCLEFSGFTPSWVILQTFLFLVSTGIAVYNTYTDWEVVLNFQQVGFNNPLLPRSIHWLRAWYLFAAIGTFLTVISVLHDALDLLYTTCKTCKKRCCNSEAKKKEESYEMDLLGKIKDDDEEIDDPCKPCYRCGYNNTTRSETLSAFTLWFQDVPMMTLAVLYAFSQTTCKTPESKDVTPFLLDIGISVSVATAASIWRLLRSFARLYSSIAVRVDPKGCFKKCLPKKGEAAYPPKTCAQICLIPFYIGLLTQIFAIIAAASVTTSIWLNYALLKSGENFDDSLGIYRLSINPPDTLLFNISGTIIPPNGTFLNLEKIPRNNLDRDEDIFCLSEFEYRSDEFQIFFNAIEVIVVSDNGTFCKTNAGPDEQTNFCIPFYTYEDQVLYYASIDPISGETERFDEQCSVVRDTFNFFATPKADFSMDVTRHIDRTGFPENGEELVIFLPTANIHFEMSRILMAENREYLGVDQFQDPADATASIFCIFEYDYVEINGQVRFNYRDIHILPSGTGCFCDSDTICQQFYQDLVFGYVTAENIFVEYTHCSEIPRDKLVPFYDQSIPVPCPCNN